jgi:hypothetical protein
VRVIFYFLGTQILINWQNNSGHDYNSQGHGNREIHFYGKCHPLSLQKLTVVNDKVIEDFMAKEDETSILKRVMKFSLDSSSNKKIIDVSVGDLIKTCVRNWLKNIISIISVD